MKLKCLLIALCFIFTSSLFGQNAFGLAPLKVPKYYNSDLAYNNLVINTLTYMAIDYDDGYYLKPRDLTPLYINRETKNFTLVDDKLAVIYTFGDTTFTLRHRFTIDRELIPEHEKLYPDNIQEENEEINITWIVNKKPLVVTLWRDELNKSLAVEK